MSTIDVITSPSDKDLFKIPPPPEDCPICMLLLPYFCPTGAGYKSCCGKIICSGCIYAVEIRDEDEMKCPFCRTPTPTSEEMVKNYEKRAKNGDVEAINSLGYLHHLGARSVTQDYDKALKLWHRAGELGHPEAYRNIGHSYGTGNGVERNEDKATHYWKLAAMAGDPEARNNVGCMEGSAGNHNRALKHYMIAVSSGYKGSLDMIRKMYVSGHATKDDYAKALREYQAFLGEIKSPQRDEAAAAFEDNKYY